MPREASRDERITAAALELLRSKGPKAVTMEAVALRADLAKTTIYRRYQDRQELLAAALTSLVQPPAPPDTSSAESILEWAIEQSYSAVADGIGVGGVAALLTEEDSAFTKLIRSLLLLHRQALTNAIQERSTASHIRRDLDVDTLLDCIVGAYLAERARLGTVRRGWADRLLAVLAPAVTRPRAAKR